MPADVALSKAQLIASWAITVPVAGVMAYTGAFGKLSGDPFSIALFTKLSTAELPLASLAEPTGRYVVAITELVAAVLLLIPATRVYGGLLTIGAMAGAISAHLLTPIGIAGNMTIDGSQQVIKGTTVPETNPVLFILAVTLLVLASVVVAIHRCDLPFMGGDRSTPAP